MNKRKINIVVANPAGNITIFVKDRFDRKDYAKVADQLLNMKELKGEQVAFICDALPSEKYSCRNSENASDSQCLQKTEKTIIGKMEMCGLEFCGNASRSFALLLAKEKGLSGQQTIAVDISGVDEILDVELNVENGYTKIKMPMPKRIFDETIFGSTFAVVDFGGIMHVIVDTDRLRENIGQTANNFAERRENMGQIADDFARLRENIARTPNDSDGHETYFEPTLENFNRFKEYINKKYNPPAMGVMFWNADKEEMIPVVYVKDVDSTYFEGSCGSGTTALSCATALKSGDGEHKFVVKQPAGTIYSTAIVKQGKIESVTIEGPVELSETITVEIEI